VKCVQYLPLSKLWELAEKAACVSAEDFSKYFDGVQSGFGIEFTEPTRLSVPISAAVMRERFRILPPQSFCFASHALAAALEPTQISSQESKEIYGA
jgi:predicted transcriptional regulator